MTPSAYPSRTLKRGRGPWLTFTPAAANWTGLSGRTSSISAAKSEPEIKGGALKGGLASDFLRVFFILF